MIKKVLAIAVVFCLVFVAFTAVPVNGISLILTCSTSLVISSDPIATMRATLIGSGEVTKCEVIITLQQYKNNVWKDIASIYDFEYDSYYTTTWQRMVERGYDYRLYVKFTAYKTSTVYETTYKYSNIDWA